MADEVLGAWERDHGGQEGAEDEVDAFEVHIIFKPRDRAFSNHGTEKSYTECHPEAVLEALHRWDRVCLLRRAGVKLFRLQ
jgi:hypothetical protein